MVQPIDRPDDELEGSTPEAQPTANRQTEHHTPDVGVAPRRLRASIVAYVVLGLAQLALVGFVVARNERIVRHGVSYRFGGGCSDGKLYFDEALQRMPPPDGFESGRALYAVLGRDEHGSAIILDLLARPPAFGDYLRLAAHVHASEHDFVRLDFPTHCYRALTSPPRRRYVGSPRLRVWNGELLVERSD